MTPMQEQYNAIKQEYNSFIVLFRLGDFYEAFNDDAKELANTLGITLTARGKSEKKTPMAGIPHHSLNSYLPKLIKAGLKIAIADQIEEAVPGKLVEREVTKVITPGSVIDETNTLSQSNNNYIACVYQNESEICLCYTDIHDGEIQIFSSTSQEQIIQEIEKINPSELLIEHSQEQFKKFDSIEPLSADYFEIGNSYDVITEHFGVVDLKGYGIEDNNIVIMTLGSLLRYLHECHKNGIGHVRSINQYDYDGFMNLDNETIRNLELLQSSDGESKTSVYHLLDECKTSLGKRLLKKWMLVPLNHKSQIQKRLDTVDFFFNNSILLEEIHSLISNIADIERITAKIGVGRVNPKDLVWLKESIIASIEIMSKVSEEKDIPIFLKEMVDSLASKKNAQLLNEFIELIETTLLDEPSAVLTEGRMIRDGYDEQVDEYRSLRKNSREILKKLQKKESETNEIPSLKVSFNKVFGYYIEITKTHLEKVPEHYVRKQTLANAERYITEELKEIEDKLLQSEELLIKREFELFEEITKQVYQFIEQFLLVAKVIASIDVLLSFAKTARDRQYVKPEISKEKTYIEDGRHIVVETLTKQYTPNSTLFDSTNKTHIITGPNMSGKSTYIRQVALMILLAQIGSFVPAKKMQWQVVDRVFTRVGAADNLAKGESTFMVEMHETANILNNATKQSLIILDEVGRGTSTYDGVAIAWSMIEFITKKIAAKTLFATHYHEVTALEKQLDSITNYTVEVDEQGGDIIFKHKIFKGSASKSYGVHVAKIAGVPQEVTKRANEILQAFENNGNAKSKEAKSKNNPRKPKSIHPEQLGLID